MRMSDRFKTRPNVVLVNEADRAEIKACWCAAKATSAATTSGSAWEDAMKGLKVAGAIFISPNENHAGCATSVVLFYALLDPSHLRPIIISPSACAI